MSWKVIGLGAFGEQVQLDVVVFGGRTGQHRTHEARFEVREHLHGGERGCALRSERLAVARAAEQPLILRQRVLDLGVLRQHRAIGHAESFGRLALRGEEIANARVPT